MPPFAPIPGKPPMMGYYQVPPDVLEDADEIVQVGEAVDDGGGEDRCQGADQARGIGSEAPERHKLNMKAMKGHEGRTWAFKRRSSLVSPRELSCLHGLHGEFGSGCLLRASSNLRASA